MKQPEKITEASASLKAVAAFTFIAFIFTQTVISAPTAFAQNSNVPGGDPVSVSTAQVLNGMIAVPPELGKMEESFQGTSGKTILFIQDAHDSLEAQENIAKLINRLVKEKGIKTVFEEGYEGLVPSDKFFSFIKNPKIKQKVSYFLMDHLRVGGAEYAHINRTKDFNLIGADSLKLHKENIDQYRLSASKKDTITKDLKALKKELKALADGRFPRELKEWLKVKEQFDTKKLDFFTYFGRTLPLIARDRSPQAKADLSLAVSPLLAFILEAVKTNDPAVIEKAKHIDAREVFGELTKIEQAVAETYLHDVTDKKLFKYYKILGLLDRLNDLQVSQEEYEAAKTSLKTFDTDSFAEFIFSRSPKTLILSRMWEQNIKDAIEFYEIAKLRDSAMEKQLATFINNPSESTAVLVFGGFHKEGIKRILAAKNISYVVVTPRITQPSPRHEEYYKRLMTDGRLSYELPADLRVATRAESRIEVWNGNAALAGIELGIMSSVVRDMPNADPRSLGLSMEKALKTFAIHGSSRSEAREEDRRAMFDLNDQAVQKLFEEELMWSIDRSGDLDSQTPELRERYRGFTILPVNYTKFPDGKEEHYYALSRQLFLKWIRAKGYSPTFDNIHVLASIFYQLENDYSGPLPKDPEQRLQFLFQTQKIKHILEIGGGTNLTFAVRLREMLQKAGVTIYEIDLNPRVESGKLDGLKAVSGDARNLQKHFPNERFDLIFSSGLLSWGGVGAMNPSETDDFFDKAMHLLISSVNHLSDNPKAAVIANGMRAHLILERYRVERMGKVFLWDDTMSRHTKYNKGLAIRYGSSPRFNDLFLGGASALIIGKLKDPARSEMRGTADVSLSSDTANVKREPAVKDLSDEIEAKLGIHTHGKLTEFIGRMLGVIPTIHDFDSFVLSQRNLLNALIQQYGVHLNHEEIEQILIRLLRWSFNLGFIDIDRLGWFNELNLDHPTIVITTRAQGGLGDITKIDLIIRGMKREFEKLKVSGTKFRVLIFDDDKEKMAILKNREYPDVDFIFLPSSEPIPENSSYLRDADVFVSLDRAVTDEVSFDSKDEGHLPSALVYTTLGQYDRPAPRNPRYKRVKISEILTGFQHDSVGFLISPFYEELYQRGLKLTEEQKLAEKKHLLAQVIHEILPTQEVSSDQLDQAARSNWGLLYMHEQGMDYLNGIAEYHRTHEPDQSVTLFTFLGETNVWYKGTKEWEGLVSKIRAAGLPVEIYDLRHDPKAIKSIDFKKPVVRLINVGMHTLDLYVHLMAASDLPVGVTGNESLFTSLLLRKRFVYEVASWERTLFSNMLSDMKNVLGEGSIAAYSVGGIRAGDISVRNAEKFWGGDPGLMEEFKRFGDSVAGRELYPQVVRKILRSSAFIRFLDRREKRTNRAMTSKSHVQAVARHAGLEVNGLGEYFPSFDLFRKASDHESGIIARVKEILNNHFSPQELKQNGDFLDVGASDGVITEALMPYFKRGVAVEIDEHVSEKLRSKEIHGLDVVTAPIQEYAPDHKFDVILVSHSLYYIEEKDRMDQIKRMASWLKPRGKLILLYTVHGDSQKDLSRMKKALGVSSQPIDGRAIKDSLTSEGFEASLEILESAVTADLDGMLKIVPFVLKKSSLQAATIKFQIQEYIERNLWDEVQHNYRLNIPQELLIISNGSGGHHKNASDGSQSNRAEMRAAEHVALYSFANRDAIMADPNVPLKYSAYKYGSQEQSDHFLAMLEAEILKKFGDQIRSNPPQWVLATTGYSLSKPSIVPLARKLSAQLGIEYVSVRAVRKNRKSGKPLIYSELKTQEQREAVQEMYEYCLESDRSYEGKNVIFIDDFFASGSALKKINTVLANKYQMRIAGNFVIISIASIETKDPAIEEAINSSLIRSRPLEEVAALLNRKDTTVTRYAVAALFQMEMPRFRELVALLDDFYLSKLFIAAMQNYRDAVDPEKMKILNDRIRASSLNLETLISHLKQQSGGLVLLGGSSGAGKTALADSLKEVLGSPVLPIDFYPSDQGATKYGIKSHELFISHNNDLVWAHISQLLQGKAVSVTSPYYYTHQFTRIINPPLKQPLIVDGLHAVNPDFIKGLPAVPIAKVFIDASRQIRFMRRLLTSSSDADYPAALMMWRNVIEAEEEAMDLWRNNADFILVEPVDAAEIQSLAKATATIRASLRDHLADVDERHDSRIVLKAILDDMESFIEERGTDHVLNKRLQDGADSIRSKRKGLKVGIVGSSKPSQEYVVADGEKLGRLMADYLRPIQGVAFTGGDSGVGTDFYRGYYSFETSKNAFFALLPTGFRPNEEYERISSNNFDIERLGERFSVRNIGMAMVGDVFIAMNGSSGTMQEVSEVLKRGKPIIALDYGGVGTILYQTKISGKIPQVLRDSGIDEGALKFIILGDINNISQALDRARDLASEPNSSSGLLSNIERRANQAAADMERDATPEDQRLIREINDRIQEELQKLKLRADRGSFLVGNLEDLLRGQGNLMEGLRKASPVIVEFPGTLDPPHLVHVQRMLEALVGVSDTAEPRTYYAAFSPIGDRFTGDGDAGTWKPNKSPFEVRYQMAKLISEIFSPLISAIDVSRDSTKNKGVIELVTPVLASDIKPLTNFYTVTGADNLEHLETYIAKDLSAVPPGIKKRFVLLNESGHPDVVTRLSSSYPDNVVVVNVHSNENGARSTEIRTKKRIGVLPISIQKYIQTKSLYGTKDDGSQNKHRSEMRLPSREVVQKIGRDLQEIFETYMKVDHLAIPKDAKLRIFQTGSVARDVFVIEDKPGYGVDFDFSVSYLFPESVDLEKRGEDFSVLLSRWPQSQDVLEKSMLKKLFHNKGYRVKFLESEDMGKYSPHYWKIKYIISINGFDFENEVNISIRNRLVHAERMEEQLFRMRLDDSQKAALKDAILELKRTFKEAGLYKKPLKGQTVEEIVIQSGERGGIESDPINLERPGNVQEVFEWILSAYQQSGEVGASFTWEKAKKFFYVKSIIPEKGNRNYLEALTDELWGKLVQLAQNRVRSEMRHPGIDTDKINFNGNFDLTMESLYAEIIRKIATRYDFDPEDRNFIWNYAENSEYVLPDLSTVADKLKSLYPADSFPGFYHRLLIFLNGPASRNVQLDPELPTWAKLFAFAVVYHWAKQLERMPNEDELINQTKAILTKRALWVWGGELAKIDPQYPERSALSYQKAAAAVREYPEIATLEHYIASGFKVLHPRNLSLQSRGLVLLRAFLESNPLLIRKAALGLKALYDGKIEESRSLGISKKLEVKSLLFLLTMNPEVAQKDPIVRNLLSDKHYTVELRDSLIECGLVPRIAKPATLFNFTTIRSEWEWETFLKTAKNWNDLAGVSVEPSSGEKRIAFWQREFDLNNAVLPDSIFEELASRLLYPKERQAMFLPLTTGDFPDQLQRVRFLALYFYLLTHRPNSIKELEDFIHDKSRFMYPIISRLENGVLYNYSLAQRQKADLSGDEVKKLKYSLEMFWMLHLGLWAASTEDSYRKLFPNEEIDRFMSDSSKRAAAIYRQFERNMVTLFRQYDQRYHDSAHVRMMGGDSEGHKSRLNALATSSLDEMLYPDKEWFLSPAMLGKEQQVQQPNWERLEAVLLYDEEFRPSDSLPSAGKKFMDTFKFLGEHAGEQIRAALQEGFSPQSRASPDPFLGGKNQEQATEHYKKVMLHAIETGRLDPWQLPDPQAVLSARSELRKIENANKQTMDLGASKGQNVLLKPVTAPSRPAPVSLKLSRTLRTVGKPRQILEFKQDVIAVVEQAKIDTLSPEMFKELLAIAGLNNSKLHLVIPDALQGKYSQRVAELRKVASVYYGFPQLAASDRIPVIGFSDMEDDTLVAFRRRLDPKLARRIKDSAFGLNQAGSFGVGILYALKDIPSDQLSFNQNGFRYDATSRYSDQVLEILQAYTVISTSA